MVKCHSLVDISFLDENGQMSPDEFVPYPPTEEELAPYHRLFQFTPGHIQDASSDQTQMLPASALPPPTGSEPADHQPPPQQGAPGQDDSKALVLSVPNSTTPPPTTTTTDELKNKKVVIDIGSDSESDDSNEVQLVLGSFTSSDLPLAVTPPTTTTTLSTSRFGESPLWLPPVSCVSPSGRHHIFSRGETTDDERTETDDDVPPSPPPPQQSLEQQLAAVVNEVNYWSKIVNRGIQGEPERPDWLPEGWEMKCVTRTNGSSAGNRDKYYIEPGVKRRQFRSKREVLEFLETGKRRQYKRKANSTVMPSTVNRPFEGTSSSSWQIIRTATHLEASTSRQNEETPNLDSDTVPEKQNEETTPNVDSDQNPPKRPCGSPSKSLRDRMTGLRRKEAIMAAPLMSRVGQMKHMLSDSP